METRWQHHNRTAWNSILLFIVVSIGKSIFHPSSIDCWKKLTSTDKHMLFRGRPMVSRLLFISLRSLQTPWWNRFSNTQSTKGKQLNIVLFCAMYIAKKDDCRTYQKRLFEPFQCIPSFQRQMNLYQFVRTPRDGVLGICKYKDNTSFRYFNYRQ